MGESFEGLKVWQKAHELMLLVHQEIAPSLPKDEKWDLADQIRRSSKSVGANIAEGFKKAGVADKRRFMNIAQGPLEECRYYLILARDLGYGDPQRFMVQLEVVSRLLDAYSRAIAVPGS